MATIDHKAEAEAILARVADIASDEVGLPIALAEAQVHATLAVAEQLRTANLIEVARDSRTNVNQVLNGGATLNPDFSAEPLESLMERVSVVDVLIREGLGL